MAIARHVRCIWLCLAVLLATVGECQSLEALSRVLSPFSRANETFVLVAQPRFPNEIIPNARVSWIVGDPCLPSSYVMNDTNVSDPVVGVVVESFSLCYRPTWTQLAVSEGYAALIDISHNVKVILNCPTSHRSRSVES